MRSPSLHSLFATQRLQRLTDGGSTQHAARCAYLVYLATAGWALAAARFLLFVLAHAVLAARPTSKAAVAAIRVIIGCRSVRVSGGGRAAKASRAPGARECRVYVANHVTDFDGYVLHGSPAALPGDAVGLFPEAYGRIPLLGPALVALARRVGYLEVSADRAARRSHLRAQIAARVAATSILVFPEGALTNGKAGVLRYSQFVFSLGIPVQPIALRVADPWPVNYDHIHTNWTTGYFWNLFFFLAAPWHNFELIMLPVAVRMEDERSPEDFARRVQKDTAAALGICATTYTISDKRKLAKALAAHRRRRGGYTFRC